MTGRNERKVAYDATLGLAEISLVRDILSRVVPPTGFEPVTMPYDGTAVFIELRRPSHRGIERRKHSIPRLEPTLRPATDREPQGFRCATRLAGMARRPGEAMISRPASPSSWRLQFLTKIGYVSQFVSQINTLFTTKFRNHGGQGKIGWQS